MSPPNQSVQWPAIIKLHAVDELIFIADAAQLSHDDTLRHTHMQAQDKLIDSTGAVYQIQAGQPFQLLPANMTLSLDDVEALLRLHLSSDGSCCVSKFHAPSIHEALISVFS